MNIKEDKKEHFWPVMFAVFFGVFLSTFNISAVNVALPTFTRTFSTSLDTVKWILTGFMLAVGTTCSLAGYLGEKLSYKKLYLYAIIGFAIASGLCAFSPNIYMLIFFRVVQGIFSGLIVPSTMTIIYQVIPRKKQALASSLWSMASMLAPAVAPTLSGWLIQKFDWRTIFLLNIPVALIAVIMIFLFIPQYNISEAKRFDFAGFASAIILSLSILIAVSEGSLWGWLSIKTLSLLALGVISTVFFSIRESKIDFPALDIKVFRFTKYTASVIALSLVTISLYIGVLLTPLFLQNVQKLSPFNTGLVLFFPSLAMALMMPLVGTLYSRVGPRVLISIGLCLIALGSWRMSSLTLTTSHLYIIFWMIIRYVGISFSTMPITNAGMSIIPKAVTGHAASINNWVRQVSSSLAIGVFSALLLVLTQQHLIKYISSKTAEKLVYASAYTSGINDLFFISTIIVLIAIPLGFTLGKEKKVKEESIDKLAS